MICPHCRSTRIAKDGHFNDAQRHRCRGCGKRWVARGEPLATNTTTLEGNGRIRSLEELLAAFNVDLKTWQVFRWKANSYEQASKDPEGKVSITPLSQVKADLERRIYQPVEFAPIAPISIGIPTLDLPPPPKREGSLALIIPDTQHGFRRTDGVLDPFHDEAALDLALQIAQLSRPDRVVLLGDHLDLPDWSDKYLVSPEMKQTTQDSLNSLASWMGHLRYICPAAQIDYIEGNHEYRMVKAITANLAAAYGLRQANHIDALPVMSVPFLLGLDKLGIQYHGPYPKGAVWLTPDLVCEHGEIAKNKSGSTAQAYLARSYSTIVGHIHRYELLHYTEWRGSKSSLRFAGSPGTLARIDGTVPSGSAHHNWQQSVWLVHIPKEGSPSVEPIGIHDKKCNFRGQWLTARSVLAANM